MLKWFTSLCYVTKPAAVYTCCNTFLYLLALLLLTALPRQEPIAVYINKYIEVYCPLCHPIVSLPSTPYWVTHRGCPASLPRHAASATQAVGGVQSARTPPFFRVPRRLSIVRCVGVMLHPLPVAPVCQWGGSRPSPPSPSMVRVGASNGPSISSPPFLSR